MTLSCLLSFSNLLLICRLIQTLHFRLQWPLFLDSSKQRAQAASSCENFVSGVIDYLRDMCVSEEVGKAMSALCCIFDICFISSTTPFQEKLTILTDFLQKSKQLGFMSMLDKQVVMQVLLQLRMQFSSVVRIVLYIQWQHFQVGDCWYLLYRLLIVREASSDRT